MDSAITARIAQDLGIPEGSVAAAVALLQKGASAPFIARYRREATSNLDEARVLAIQDRMADYKEILDRRASLIALLTNEQRLTDELRQRIEKAWSRAEIENLHAVFKPRRKTRASEAREKGLESLAQYIVDQEADAWSLEEHVDVCINTDRQVTTREQALLGALDIIAEWIAENLELRDRLREYFWKEGALVSSVVPARASQKTKYSMYYDRKEPVTSVPSHRFLAIRRGTKEGILVSAVEVDNAKAIEMILSNMIRDRESMFSPLLEIAARDAYNRIMRPMLEAEVRSLLKERADRDAIRVFQENLSNLLLSPPAGNIVVLGADLTRGEECHLAAVGENGELLDEAVIRLKPRRPVQAQAPRPARPRPARKPAASPAKSESAAAPEPPAAKAAPPAPQSEAVAPDAPSQAPEAAAPASEPAAVAEDPSAAKPEAAPAEPPIEPIAEPVEPVSSDVEPSASIRDDGEVKAFDAPPPEAENAPVETGASAPDSEGSPTAEPTAGPGAEGCGAEASPGAEQPLPETSPEAAGSGGAQAETTVAAEPPADAKLGEAGVPVPEEAQESRPGTAEPPAAPAPAAPEPPIDPVAAARPVIAGLIAKHGVRAIAIAGNAGTRALESLLRLVLSEEKIENVPIAAVNDAGLAIYASSRPARDEFPQLSISARCAVSLARRLQDPLGELVKIDPKLIGVGQYQHDVDQKELHRSLTHTVRSCVSRVGVDPNTASASLLHCVPGLNDKLARRIASTRAARGRFGSRADLLAVPGLDASAFEQSAGFLRLRGAENPIDRTAIHPESYPIVEKMAASLGVAVQDLVGNAERVGRIRLDEFAAEGAGLATLTDIREELLRPGRDPRRTFALPKFRSDVRDVSDLKEGMALEGIVTNVTNFGAFVDIGVHQDGLVHLSQISNRFVRDPREAVKVGDVVQVKVLSVEPETKRIGLSIKALLPQLNRRRRHPDERRPGESAGGPAAGGTREGGARDSRPGRPPMGRGDRGPRPDMRGRRPDRPDGRRDGRREGRPRRPGDDRDRKEPLTLTFDTPSPTLPEGTDLSLSEKIEILRTKFRGIK